MSVLAPEGLAFFVAKAALLLLLACAGARLAGRASAALRHAILVAGAVAALLVAPLQALLPGWSVGIDAAVGAAPATGPLEGFPLPAGLWAPGIWALGIWALGASALMLATVRSRLACRRLVRDARPVRDARLLSLAIDCRDETGFRGPLRIRLSDRVPVPLCAGLLRPFILLPSEAVRWCRSRRRAVLLHELSHIKRRDCLTQFVAEVCRALYWFLPPAWWNLRSMRYLREVASDDRVLARGARPSGYAAFLLRAFRAPRPRSRAIAAAAALGNRHELTRRIGAVLATDRPRGGAGRTGLSVAVVAALLACLLSAAGATRTPPPGQTDRTHHHEVRLSVSTSASAHAGFRLSDE